MKRILMVVIIGLGLAGCDARTYESTSSYILPNDLVEKGCKIYHMRGKQENSLDVVYCPNAQVTSRTKVGKSPATSATTVDGAYYE